MNFFDPDDQAEFLSPDTIQALVRRLSAAEDELSKERRARKAAEARVAVLESDVHRTEVSSERSGKRARLFTDRPEDDRGSDSSD